MDPQVQSPDHETKEETIVNVTMASPDETAGLQKAEDSRIELTEESMIENICKQVPEVGNHFTILNKIGEGAFSTVYRARLKHYPEVTEMFALKVVIPTSHPSRIENELRCLLNIGNQDNVMGVKLCLRHRDHVIIVMPLFPHEKFQEYIPLMTLHEAREYMRNLLVALRRVHHFNVIHRDIKPSNFLYNRQTKQYALVDFGLASGKILTKPEDEKICDKPLTKNNEAATRAAGCSSARPATPRIPLSPSKKAPSGNIMLPPSSAPSRQKGNEKAMSLSRKLFQRQLASSSPFDTVSQGLCDCFGRPVICSLCVARNNQVAPRAGTAGFRAPEVLMKSPDQDTGVDVWSAGVIFLSVLSTRYPFFKAQDDMGHLAQIISLLGTEPCVKAAKAIDKQLTVSEQIAPVDLKYTCMKLRGTNNTPKAGVDLEEVAKSWENISDLPFDLLAKMLDPNPRTRILAEEALKHPWFTENLES